MALIQREQELKILKSLSQNVSLNHQERSVIETLLKETTGLETKDNTDDKENYEYPKNSQENPKRYASRRKIHALQLQSIEEDCIACARGCERECHTHFNKYDILRYRKQFHLRVMGFDQQTELLKMYRSSLFQKGRGKTLHVVDSRLVCRLFWYRTVVNISKRTYQRVVRMKKHGIESILTPEAFSNKGYKGKIAVGFMEYYVSVMGDHSPENSRILMPHGITIKDIYEEYKSSYDVNMQIQLGQFYKMWNSRFSHVSFYKHSKFTKCNVCMLARHLLQQNITPELRTNIIKDRDEHLNRQQNERNAYYMKRAEAVAKPNEIMSLIVDGMDQSKTNLPHFSGWQLPKAIDPVKLLQTHVTGVMIHGKRTFMYLDYLQWPHDSNLTLNVVLRAIVSESLDGKLPPTLYIQMDNCARENKNKYFIATMALLVKHGFVKEVIMGFLMVGHTHEDIDSRFSRISAQLKKKEAKTLPELIDVINGSLKDQQAITTELLPAMFNIRDWIKPTVNSIHDHTVPHVYWLYNDKPNHVALKYKNWSTDSQWRPESNEESLEIFLCDETTGDRIIPDGKPDLITPDSSKKNDFKEILTNIEKNKHFLTARELWWWEEFLASDITVDMNCQQWYFEYLQPHTRTETEIVITDIAISPLALVMGKERGTAEVSTGRKRKRPSSVINDVDQHQKKIHINVGCMVLYKKKRECSIGEVTQISGKKIYVNAYSGSITSEWNVLMTHDNNIVTDEIQKSDILDSGIFILTKSRRLPTHIINILKTLQ